MARVPHPFQEWGTDWREKAGTSPSQQREKSPEDQAESMTEKGASSTSEITETLGLPSRARRPVDPIPRIPDYRFVKTIGRGAFGTVWLAEETMAGVFRAVKVLRPGGPTGQAVAKKAAAKRVQRELDGIHAYQVQAKDHPHLVRILRTGLCTLTEPDPLTAAHDQSPDQSRDRKGAVNGPSESTSAATVKERNGWPASSEVGEAIASGEMPSRGGPDQPGTHPPAKAGGSSTGAPAPPRPPRQAVFYVMEIADHAAGPQPHQPADYQPLTLATLLQRQGRLAGPRVVEHAIALLEAIDHLHKAGLRHRDVKPANCLFVGGLLKLADMGLTASAQADEFVGTPGYLPPAPPPDQDHEHHAADSASSTSDGPANLRAFAPPEDLYALGKVIYEMTTGLAAAEYPDWPADLDPTADPHLRPLRDLINRLCHPHPPKRLSTPRETRRRLATLATTSRGFRTSPRVAGLLLGLVAIAGIFAGGLGMKSWFDSFDPTKKKLGQDPYNGGAESTQSQKFGNERFSLSRRHSPEQVYTLPGLNTITRIYDLQTRLIEGKLAVYGAYQIYNELNPITGDITINDGAINQIYLIAGEGPDAPMACLYHGQPGAEPGVKARFGRSIQLDEIPWQAEHGEEAALVYLAWTSKFTPQEAELRYHDAGIEVFHPIRIARLTRLPASTPASHRN